MFEEIVRQYALDKKIDGIVEVRDESDKNDELRIVIDLRLIYLL